MKYTIRVIGLLFVLIMASCEDFLSERSFSSTSNPNTTRDLQAMLDAGNMINFGSYPLLIEAATDNFFVGKNGFDRLSDFDKDIYLWKDKYLFASVNEGSSWTSPFHAIAIANTVLNELPNTKELGGLSPQVVEGMARFHRAFTYLMLVQNYCKAYDPETVKIDLGLPIRLSADINQRSVRSTLEETFNIIEEDIRIALVQLPWTSDYQTRPNKVAAHALMARLYVIMERYEEALEHANLGLARYQVLMDFNLLDGSRPFPIPALNEETIFFAYASGASILNPSRECFVDTVLYDSYEETDLRKQLFFKSENNGYHSFRGSFFGLGTSSCFVGLTVSELLLIQAECLARAGQTADAMNTLNLLLDSRFVRGTLALRHIENSADALSLILEERRKELIFRGARWSDLKRLNRDPRFARTLYRKVPGDEGLYELPPNDSRYVFLIPQTVIETTGMIQNER